jgi:hypothetical protein
MGTPQVNCMSKLPTAHEPAARRAAPSGDGQRRGGTADVGGQIGAGQLEALAPRDDGPNRELPYVCHDFRSSRVLSTTDEK